MGNKYKVSSNTYDVIFTYFYLYFKKNLWFIWHVPWIHFHYSFVVSYSFNSRAKNLVQSYKIIHYLSLCLHEDIYLGRYLEISSSPPSLNWQLFRPFRFCHRFWNPPCDKSMVYFLSKFSLEITNLLSYVLWYFSKLIKNQVKIYKIKLIT